MEAMKLKIFKCHAVMPPCGDAGAHAVRTYYVAAASADTARARVREEARHAEFVTAPVAMTEALSELRSDLLLTKTATISARELSDLRSAHRWGAGALLDQGSPTPGTLADN
jgi:hypothetical protein